MKKREIYVIFLIAALALGMPMSSNAVLKAEIETDKGFHTHLLISISDAGLVYRPPDVPTGVRATLPLNRVISVHFGVKYDQKAVFLADRENRWTTAARLILESTMPMLPFLSLPENDAVAPSFEAGQYLERAANAYVRRGDAESAAKARKLYAQALKIFSAVAKADWHYLAEPAMLKVVCCQIGVGKIDEAAAGLREARIPEPYDGAYGQYWLAKARLLLAQDDTRAACNAAAKTVIFDNKNVSLFPDALMLFAYCHEEIMEWHRARDVYYEVARLFPRTEWGDAAFKRLKYIMENGFTEENEAANIAKVFFGVEEDMNALVNELIEKREKIAEKLKEGAQ